MYKGLEDHGKPETVEDHNSASYTEKRAILIPRPIKGQLLESSKRAMAPGESIGGLEGPRGINIPNSLSSDRYFLLPSHLHFLLPSHLHSLGSLFPLPGISIWTSFWPNPVRNQKAGTPFDAGVKFSLRQRAERRRNRIQEEQEENMQHK